MRKRLYLIKIGEEITDKGCKDKRKRRGSTFSKRAKARIATLYQQTRKQLGRTFVDRGQRVLLGGPRRKVGDTDSRTEKRAVGSQGSRCTGQRTSRP